MKLYSSLFFPDTKRHISSLAKSNRWRCTLSIPLNQTGYRTRPVSILYFRGIDSGINLRYLYAFLHQVYQVCKRWPTLMII
uniref:AlNc14C21G2160 protein n=1 Tax=Albugo laibachii Nc14 TaxID=890382 RepID=F0W5J5_9STRA|nr:AlNc14C21G2160 [Albugo laibachii Nc14]|eukprot:CCA16386.1 AlNc14C21G2160 [Albugo laibachii Nc14]